MGWEGGSLLQTISDSQRQGHSSWQVHIICDGILIHYAGLSHCNTVLITARIQP